MSEVISCKISHPSVGRDSDAWGALCTPIVILRQKNRHRESALLQSLQNVLIFFVRRVAGSIVNLDSAVKSRLKEKSMKKTMLKSLALAVVGSMCAVGAANAAMLEGGLSMSGSFIPVDAKGDLTSILLATGIDFGPMYTGGVDNTFGVVTATGDFDVLNPNSGDPQTTGTINNFQFDPFVALGTPLWLVGGFSFEMSSLTSDTIPKAGSYDLTIYGLGTMTAPGFEPTPGIWNFTGQGAGGTNFSWSASAAAAPVPEPATMLLFGTGLIGLAGLRRKIGKKTSPLQKDEQSLLARG